MREWFRETGRRPHRFAGLVAFAIAIMAVSSAFAIDTVDLPDATSGWILPDAGALGRPASEMGSIEIRGVGELTFDPTAVETLRPDLFVEGQFSVFDVLVHLADTGLIELEYTFDEAAQTHVVQTVNGLNGWWYDAHYGGGSFDKTVVRMDCFPVKDGMSIVLYLEDTDRLAAIHAHYREEVTRKGEDVLVVPLVVLRSAAEKIEFTDVAVTSHNARPDVFQPGTLTILDVLLSLGEQGALDGLKLEWRATEDDIAVIDGYYVVSIRAGDFAPERTGNCVLTHQIGGATIQDYLTPHSHTMSHIHLTGDLEALVAPGTVEWLWVCL
ncbi:hypothetical protein KJ567_00300 [Candidatus Bipolaricaulota bacterium]|nr:hypothetical protein [Candidatus Bipolaricaulota bacterium]